MPFREISNNAQALPRGVKGYQSTKKSSTTSRQKVLHASTNTASSSKPRASTLPVSYLAVATNQHIVVSSNQAVIPTVQKIERKEPRENVFFDTVNDWNAFLTEDIETWSKSPRFKQNNTSFCCLLCGKSIRGLPENEILVQKHVKGSHHKKTFQLMDNLKKLKEQEPSRLDVLIQVISEPSNIPTPSCTPKQLLAYYHNVAIQALQSKKSLDGIVAHFRRRFLYDKVQLGDVDDTHGTELNLGNSLKDGLVESAANPKTAPTCHEESVTTIDGSATQETNARYEENEFGLVVQSPVTRQSRALMRSVDTPMPGAMKDSNRDLSESQVDLKPESPVQSFGNKVENGACESPASDISQQSELCWMAAINEADDALAILDGSLDTGFDKMIAKDEDDASIMSMPMMVVTQLEDMDDIDVDFLLSIEFENTNDVFSTGTEDDKIIDEFLACETGDCLESSLDTAEGPGEHPISPQHAPSEMERRLKIKQSLECIAALAFVNE